MNGRTARASEDICFEQRVLAAYGPLCEIFFYTKLVDVMHLNWDRTSRQTAIQQLAEAQPLYLQPESVQSRNVILMVNANGRGVGHLEPHTAEEIAKGLRDGREWHAHVRSVDRIDNAKGCDVVVMLLLMVTPERYAQLVEDRRMLADGTFLPVLEIPAKNFNFEWTVAAILLLGVAITML